MRPLLLILFCCTTLLSCNDGDVLNIQLDFDKNLTLCGDSGSSNYILYDTKDDPFESLTLLFPNNAQVVKVSEFLAFGVIATLLLLLIWPEIIFVTLSTIILFPLKFLIN